jgi:PAS domain S-box-containing protein
MISLQDELELEAAQRLAAIVESSDDAIISKDLNGVITSWNSGAERLFGYAASEAIGRPVTILIPVDRHAEEPAILARIRRGEHVDHYETVRQRKNGSLVEISLTVSPIRNAKGQVVGASKIARNITERKRAEEERDLLLKEMSHRIKNLFTLAGSIVAISARDAETPKALAQSVQERLAALGRAHDLTLTRPSRDKLPGTRPVGLHALIETILLPFEIKKDGKVKRAVVTGPDILIGATRITAFALLLHELATNSAKYGALSAVDGHVDLECRDAGEEFVLSWNELGGPYCGQAGEGDGFGSFLVRATVEHQLCGELTRENRPGGLSVRVVFPRSQASG